MAVSTERVGLAWVKSPTINNTKGALNSSVVYLRDKAQSVHHESGVPVSDILTLCPRLWRSTCLRPDRAGKPGCMGSNDCPHDCRGDGANTVKGSGTPPPGEQDR